MNRRIRNRTYGGVGGRGNYLLISPPTRSLRYLPPPSFPFKSVIIRSGYVLGSMLVIFLVSWIFCNLSHDILYLWLIPPIVAGVFFLLPGGIIIGIVSATATSSTSKFLEILIRRKFGFLPSERIKDIK